MARIILRHFFSLSKKKYLFFRCLHCYQVRITLTLVCLCSSLWLASPVYCYVSFYVTLRWKSRYSRMRYSRELKIRRRRRQRKQQKSNRFRLVKPQVCTCITLFCTFRCRRCTTTPWKCLISRFVEDGDTRQQLSFSVPERWYSPLESTPKNLPAFDELNEIE